MSMTIVLKDAGGPNEARITVEQRPEVNGKRKTVRLLVWDGKRLAGVIVNRLEVEGFISAIKEALR